MNDPLTARTVAAAVRRAGYPTGYRYSRGTYRTRDGRPITKAGTDVTRAGGGGVYVYVATPDGDDGTEARATIDVLATALAEAFPGRTITKAGVDHLRVSDFANADVNETGVLLYTVTVTVKYEGTDEADAAQCFRDDYLLPASAGRLPITVQRADGRGEPVTITAPTDTED